MKNVTKVNVYHDSNDNWFFAAWCGSEYDCNNSIDNATNQSEAVAWAKTQFPNAEVKVVEPVK